MLSRSEIIARSLAPSHRKSGIYFLISATDEILYVGQSVDIETRVGIQRRKIEFARWAWEPCSKADMDALERAYITALDPPQNCDPLTLTARGIRRPARQRTSTWGRRIRTPDGDFASVAAAARHFKVSTQAIWQRADRGKNGWKFLETQAGLSI